MSLPDDIKNVKNEKHMNYLKNVMINMEKHIVSGGVIPEEPNQSKVVSVSAESLETLLNPSDSTIHVKVLGK